MDTNRWFNPSTTAAAADAAKAKTGGKGVGGNEGQKKDDRDLPNQKILLPGTLPPKKTLKRPNEDTTTTTIQQSKGTGKQATSDIPTPPPPPPPESKKKKVLRTAAGQVWEDAELADWDPNDFRIFVGDLGKDVTEQMLQTAFSAYPSLNRVRIVRDHRRSAAAPSSSKASLSASDVPASRGYGFVSFTDPHEFARALREMNGKYVGSRPIKLKRSTWKDRNV